MIIIKNLVNKKATFDNPKNPHCRWGRIIKVCRKTKRVWISYIGWGYVWELRKIK